MGCANRGMRLWRPSTTNRAGLPRSWASGRMAEPLLISEFHDWLQEQAERCHETVESGGLCGEYSIAEAEGRLAMLKDINKWLYHRSRSAVLIEGKETDHV